MSNRRPNKVERLLVSPGNECACCVGRFGFEHGLRALRDERPLRTRKEVLKLNPLFVRQLPSFRHQEVHVENMMKSMGSELPKLFRKWRKHLQTYPEIPYLLHFVLSSGRLHLSEDVLSKCKKESPYRFGAGDQYGPVGFTLKKLWSNVEVVQEILLSFASQLAKPIDGYPSQGAYLPQIIATLSDHLKELRKLHRDAERLGDGSASEESEQRRNTLLYTSTILKQAFRNLAEIIIPAVVNAIESDPDCDRNKQVRLTLTEFFDAGGSYANRRLNISKLLFSVDRMLLLFLDEHRDKLNGESVTFLIENVDDVRRTMETLRAEATEERERQRIARQHRLAEEQAREREHQEREAERAARREMTQAARTAESLCEMTQRLSALGPVERMMAIASQAGYAPASFPKEWADDFTDVHIGELDGESRSILRYKTRGVQRGGWKILHTRLVQFIESRPE